MIVSDNSNDSLKKNLEMPYVIAAIPHSNNTCLKLYPPTSSFKEYKIIHCTIKQELLIIIKMIFEMNVTLFNISRSNAYLIDNKDTFN